MEREEIRRFLLSEIEKEQEKIRTLGKMKAEADGARTSWSSHQVSDLEDEISQHNLYLTRCQVVLRSLEGTTPPRNIGVGSIVTLSIEGDVEKYLVLREGGGAIGECFVLSARSPIGKVIWGKQAGQEVRAKTPQGTVPIKILKVA